MKFILGVVKVMMIAVLLGVCVYGYSKYIEPKLLVINEFQIECCNSKQQEIKIAQFSDTHIGEYYTLEQLEELVFKINEQNPDIIVFTGDLIDEAKEFDQIHDIAGILGKLNAPLGKFAVWGNHDYGGGAQWHYPEILEEADFTLLTNDIELVTVNEELTLAIAGLDEVMLGDPDVLGITQRLNAEYYNILLLHEPDLIDEFYDSKINLALGGHSHGGQVTLPFIGPLVTTSYGEKYIDGWYKINEETNLELYVNTGIGNTKVPFRLLNIPEVSVFKIKY